MVFWLFSGKFWVWLILLLLKIIWMLLWCKLFRWYCVIVVLSEWKWIVVKMVLSFKFFLKYLNRFFSYFLMEIVEVVICFFWFCILLWNFNKLIVWWNWVWLILLLLKRIWLLLWSELFRWCCVIVILSEWKWVVVMVLIDFKVFLKWFYNFCNYFLMEIFEIMIYFLWFFILLWIII